MSYLSEAHNEWHAVNGHDAICPLDCGNLEYLADQAQDAWLDSLYTGEIRLMNGTDRRTHVVVNGDVVATSRDFYEAADAVEALRKGVAA